MLTFIWIYISVGTLVIMGLDMADEINIDGAVKKVRAILLWPIIVIVCFIMKDWKMW